MISLLVMAMMVMVVVVLASFIKVESTLASSKQAETIARFNALAAVRLAGAALQERLGPDTRVSAPASIYENPLVNSESSPGSDPFDYPVLGAWRSWEGLNHDSRLNSRYAGRPEKPDYTTKLRVFNPDPANAAGQRNRFLGWMLSSQMGYGQLNFTPATAGTSTKPPAPPSVVASANTVPLVGATTDVKPVRQVNVEPISFIDGRSPATTTDGSQGFFSWWVSGENQKVRVITPTVTLPSAGTNYLEWANRSETFGAPDLAAISYPAKAPELYHDVSLFSEGLLTNTATGGLRKDLSLFAETWDLATSLDSTRVAKMPLFRVRPAKAPKATGDPDHDLVFLRPLPDSQLPAGVGNRRRKTLPYWWADYGSLGGTSAGVASDGGTNFGGYGRLSSFPPVRSWAYLTDHYLHYRKYVTNPDPQLGAVTEMLPPQASNSSTGDLYNYYERVFRHPLIARIQYVFATAGTPTPPNFAPGFLAQPVVTLWNPFNVRLTVPSFGINCKWQTLPIYINCNNGDTGALIASRRVGEYFNWLRLNFDGPGNITLEPGQTRVFAMPRRTIVNLPMSGSTPMAGDQTVTLQPGYDADGTSGIQMQLAGTQPPGTKLRYAMAKDIDREYLTKRDGIYYDNYPVNYGYSPVRFSFEGTNTIQFRQLYGEDPAFSFTMPIESLTAQPRAFGTFAFGLRLSNDGVAQYDSRTGIKTVSKGVLQASPFTTYTELGQKSAEVLTALRYSSTDVTNSATQTIAAQIGLMSGAGSFYSSANSGVQYGGALNVINAPYDLYFLPLTDFKDATVPQVDMSNQGYILTGQDAATGLSRAVFAELPVKPLQSLASLQNCDIRATNPAPPFHFNVIGNSDASPVLPPDDVVGRWIDQTRATVSRDMIPVSFLQYDDSYCLNHVLFDDWFVSSLAPLPSDWASLRPSTGTEFTWNPAVMTSLKNNWASFAAGTTTLPNRCYQPALNAASLDLDVRSAGPYAGNPVQPVAYQRVAASLRVPGQFNVNSTSVAAWRAMLGNLRSTTVPFIRPGNTTVTTATNVNNPLSRMAISHEGPVTTGGNSASVLGFSALTDAQLDRLAVEMVKQVKLRGPFLSLSEFVNRQLALPLPSDPLDPSLSGAIGTALRALENASAALNPAERPKTVGKTTSKLSDFGTLASALKLGDWTLASGEYSHPKAAEGSSTFGLPGWPRQADVLERLAPVITVRDDTFVVRAMGTSPLFNGATGTVWCEAVYQRLPEYVDASVPAHEAPAGDVNSALTPTRRANAPLGRRMRLVSFRWLTSKEL